MHFPRIVLLVGTCLCIFGANPMFAQNTDRIARATRVNEAPVIDGFLDEAVWQLADAITGFTQTWPVQGEPATEETIVRVLYTDTAVYVGAFLYDTEPAQILVTDSRRDSGMAETDSFQVIFDTYRDLQNGFVFGTNPAGIEFDGQVINEGADFNLNWDASWVVRTQITDTGWLVEFEIPLRSLRYGESPQVWGINFERNIRRKRELVYWAPIERIYDLHRLSEAGVLQGLELETPRNFKVTPYVVSSVLRDYTNPDQFEADFDADSGVDAKFGVTPSLNLDVTYNTDFAQVEVDEQVVNLTRFNVRFPEKRPFFLENAGLFAAGKQGVDLFFSRRIGIDPSGLEVPIIGGVRLSGKAGAFNVGLMNMQTDDVPGVTPQNNFTVARVTRELPNRSSLGGIMVSRDAIGMMTTTDDWNRTWGIDGRLGIGQYMDIRGFAARTETPGSTGSETSYNTRISYARPGGNTNFEYTQVGDDFNPEAGFLNRRAYRSVSMNVFQNFRFPNITWLRELRPHALFESFWDLEGFKESDRLHMDSHVDFENGWYFSPAVNVTLEGLKDPFEISPGVIIPAGSYRNAEIDWRFDSDPSRPLSFATTWTFGGFYTGNQRTIQLELAGRHGSNVNTSINWTRSDINMREGEFVTNLVQGRFNYSFTPLINFQSLVQYNTRSNSWTGNFRFGWQNTAGTGLFIVYNEVHELDTLDALRRRQPGEPMSRALIVKYSHQFDIFR
jgi:hypothetical protein